MKFQITEDAYLIESEKWDDEFKKSPWKLLYRLGLSCTETDNEAFNYLIRFTSDVIQTIADNSDIEFVRSKIECTLEDSVLQKYADGRPFCIGDNFIDIPWLTNIQGKIVETFREEISEYTGTVESYFAVNSTAFKVANRIFFHLVENRENTTYPFAFLVTYANEKSRHTPLENSIKEFKKNQEKLIALLSPLSRIAEKSKFIKKLIESGEIMKAVAITPEEALEFLKEIPVYEANGVFCRIPNFWKNRKKHGFSAGITVGKKTKSLLGLNSIVDFEPEIMLDGLKLTKAELNALLKEAEGLRLIKGQWVEVNHEELKSLISKVELVGNQKSLTLLDVLRNQMGIDTTIDPEIEIKYSDYLSLIKKSLLTVSGKEVKVPAKIKANLRPYQKSGFNYLVMMDSLGLGACMADDMGLGKTLQVITLFAHIMEQSENSSILVIVPTSLVGNWQAELGRFLPSCKVKLLTESAAKSSKTEIDNGIYITTYGLLGKLENVKNHQWRLAVLDEAQAIKNSTTAQSKSARSITATNKIAITGTPVENSAQDLWSLFDYINPGLLGSKADFAKYIKSASENNDYGKLRNTISPFILRRMKTDKSIISDLPDKIEQKEYPLMTKLQVKLYENVVKELEQSIYKAEGIERKGLVLSSIMKLKQICNHPDQYSGQSSQTYLCDNSGKFIMLSDICSEINKRHEKVLVFTQFKEIIPAIDSLLSSVFNANGLTLDGSVAAKKRTELVNSFNQDSSLPYMILSLKAGGVGLNLTAANHVVHFDRWWNPAVENQATDRAFRIGQKKNVIVHSFITKGTIEEKIDQMLEQKKELSKSLLSSAGESWITELSNEELINMCRFGELEK